MAAQHGIWAPRAGLGCQWPAKSNGPYERKACLHLLDTAQMAAGCPITSIGHAAGAFAGFAQGLTCLGGKLPAECAASGAAALAASMHVGSMHVRLSSSHHNLPLPHLGLALLVPSAPHNS